MLSIEVSGVSAGLNNNRQTEKIKAKISIFIENQPKVPLSISSHILKRNYLKFCPEGFH